MRNRQERGKNYNILLVSQILLKRWKKIKTNISKEEKCCVSRFKIGYVPTACKY